MAIDYKVAKKEAMDNYDTWGQWIIESYTDGELRGELTEFKTLKDWIEFRKRVHSCYKEVMDTAF